MKNSTLTLSDLYPYVSSMMDIVTGQTVYLQSYDSDDMFTIESESGEAVDNVPYNTPLQVVGEHLVINGNRYNVFNSNLVDLNFTLAIIGKHNDKELITFIMQSLLFSQVERLRAASIETIPDFDLFSVLKNLVKDFMMSHFNSLSATEYECIEKYLSQLDFIPLVCKCELIDTYNIQAGTFEKYNMPTILDDDGNEVILDEYLKLWVQLNGHFYDGRFVYI